MIKHVAGMDEDTSFAVLAVSVLVQTVAVLGFVGRYLGDAQFMFSVSIATVAARRTSVRRRQEVAAELGLVVALGTEERLQKVGSVGSHDG